MTFLLYLGKVMLCSGILLGYYWLFLRNKRFHHYNRFYLQATMLVSVVLPFVRIPVLNQSQNVVNQAVYQTIEVLTVNYGEDEGMASAPGKLAKLFTLANAVYLLYATGIIVLLWMLVRSLLYIRRISKQYPYERVSGLKFFTTSEPSTPFSFFRSIFWNRDLPFNSHDGQQIFRHELFHVQQKHSTDIILTELVTAFFWFNPFFHILKKELKAIHEFLADQYAISNNDRYAYAELLVMQTFKTNHTTITNYFFQNHIKRRITMITNNHSARYSYGSRLMALPLLALLFCTVALYAQQTANTGRTISYTDSDKAPLTVVIDAGHGGIDAGATSIDGKVKEKDLALQISRKIQQLAPSYNVNVVMTRTDDNLPGGKTVIPDALKARTEITEKAKADLFIAIHVSSTDPDNPDPAKSGIEVYIPNKENDRTNQSKQVGAVLVQELNTVYKTDPVLKQRSQNIWVLEQTSCPALLIECGFITNEKDLAFFTNSSNQEAVAKKILEGIINSKNKPVAAVKASTETAKPETAAKPATIIRTSTPATPSIVTQAANVTDAPYYQEVPKQGLKEISFDPTDPVTQKLSRHFCRATRYPNQVLNNNGEGIVYFSISIDVNGEIKDLQLYDKPPAEADLIKKIIVVGYPACAQVAATPISKEEINTALQAEIKRAWEKKPDLSGLTPQTTPYFFRVQFQVEPKPSATT
jgi:N-acetylmuramoyl-L-alanine amidase